MCPKQGKPQWQAKASAPVPPATGPAALPSSSGSSAPAAVDLAGMWDELPGAARYSAWIEALDGEGRTLARTAPFAFHKVASFTGGYRKAARPYAESGRRCAEYVLKTLAAWKTIEPGKAPQVELPALFYSAYIRVLVTYAEQDPQAPAAAEALATATKIGLHMIKASTPADWAWPNMPLSHKPGGYLQVCRTAMAGMVYLDLLRATGDKRFLDAAMKIADTLKARQLPEGRWHFRVDPKSGKCAEDYTSDQAEAVCFLDALIAGHGRSDLAAARDKAVKWMLDNPVRTNYWQQQWDDVGVVAPLHNLEFYDTVFLGLYLLDHATQANGYVEIARGLHRYVEDQFVLWEDSFDPTFIAPGVLEQYVCYITIDWHAAHYIRFCMALHKATGEGVYLDKARAMADTLTVIQHVDGYYPTWMRMTPAAQPGGLGRIDYNGLWPNCMSYTGEMLMKLGRYIDKTPQRVGGTSASR
jgi:hypothetical protein